MIFKKHKTQKPYSDYSTETMEHKDDGKDAFKAPEVGLPWRSNGWDSAFPLRGVWVQPLAGELGSPHAVCWDQNN